MKKMTKYLFTCKHCKISFYENGAVIQRDRQVITYMVCPRCRKTDIDIKEEKQCQNS